MKKLKAKLGLLAISLGLTFMPASAAVVNVPVVDDAWTFIGVPGFQTYGATTTSSSGAWTTASATTPVIVDAAGAAYQVSGMEVPTWDGNVTSPAATSGTASVLFETENSTTSTYPARTADSGAGVGSDIYGTVGLMVLGQDTTSQTKSSTTDHDGAYVAALQYTALVKDYESPIRSMYIRSATAGSPDIKVLYMANYEGDSFLIRVDTTATATSISSATTGVTTYQGTFSRDYTYENAAVLGTDFGLATDAAGGTTGGSNVTGVIAAFDMNLADNNLSAGTTGASAIEPSTTSGSLRQSLDGNLTVLTWDSATQSWRMFKATGTGTVSAVTANTANDFSDLEMGKGYWVKLENDGNPDMGTPSGFVLGYSSGTRPDHTSYLSDGWNMLSFGDEYLSYSVTGFRVGGAIAATADINITDTYGATVLNIPLNDASVSADCALINQAIDRNNSFGFTNMNIKCIPSTAEDEMILLSTRRFVIQTNDTTVLGLYGTTALGSENNGSSNNFYKSRFGNHAMIIDDNTAFRTNTGSDANMSVEFPVTTSSAAYAAIGTTTSTNAAAIKTAMDSAGGSSATNTAIAVDMDYDGTDDGIFMASDYRFFAKDETLVRVFDYSASRADTTNNYSGNGQDNQLADNNTTAYIVGKSVTTISTDSNITVWDDNLSGTEYSINRVAANTEVNASKLEGDEDNTTIMLYYTGWNATASTRVGKVDMQELGESWDLFTEIHPDNESNLSAKGGIVSVWNISSIVDYIEDENTSQDYDGNYSYSSIYATSDLRNVAFYSQNFPVTGPLYDMRTTYGVNPELIITGQTEASYRNGTEFQGNFISWKQIDVTKDVTEWYDNDDQYELFWTEKEKGYWIYIDGTHTGDLSFETPRITGTPYAHFNNFFQGSSTTGTTRNHLNHTMTVTVNNLTQVAQATANNDAFEVQASIGGYITSFARSSATNGFTIPLNSHETSGLSFDAGTVDITITAANGNGDTINTSYSLDYSKPSISGVTLANTTATVAITNGATAASDIYVYNGDINDSSYAVTSAGLNSSGTAATNWAGSATGQGLTIGDTTAINLAQFSALAFPTSFENNSTAYEATTAFDDLREQILEGLIRDVRITALDGSPLFSDQERVYYLPIYAGSGILSSSSSASAGWDASPTVYTSTGDVNSSYGAGIVLDDGVQLKTAVNGTTVTCAYAHQAGVTLDQTVAIERTIDGPDGTAVAEIAYNPAYVARPFYCEISGVLYVGGFIPETNQGDIPLAAVSTSVTGISITK